MKTSHALCLKNKVRPKASQTQSSALFSCKLGGSRIGMTGLRGASLDKRDFALSKVWALRVLGDYSARARVLVCFTRKLCSVCSWRACALRSGRTADAAMCCSRWAVLKGRKALLIPEKDQKVPSFRRNICTRISVKDLSWPVVRIDWEVCKTF